MAGRGGLYLGYLLAGACAVMLIIAGVRRGTWVDVVSGVALIVIVAAVSPPGLKRIIGLFPKPAPAEQVAAARVVIYHRPLCSYCTSLRDQLGKARSQVLWVNIWRDPDAAARVREINDGNELVPTVVIDGVPHANPDPAIVRDALEESRR